MADRAIAIRGAIDNGGRRDRREGGRVNVDLTILPLAVGARRAAPLALGQRAGKGASRERDRRREQTQDRTLRIIVGVRTRQDFAPIIREAGESASAAAAPLSCAAPAMA